MLAPVGRIPSAGAAWCALGINPSRSDSTRQKPPKSYRTLRPLRHEVSRGNYLDTHRGQEKHSMQRAPTPNPWEEVCWREQPSGADSPGFLEAFRGRCVDHYGDWPRGTLPREQMALPMHFTRPPVLA